MFVLMLYYDVQMVAIRQVPPVNVEGEEARYFYESRRLDTV